MQVGGALATSTARSDHGEYTSSGCTGHITTSISRTEDSQVGRIEEAQAMIKAIVLIFVAVFIGILIYLGTVAF